MKTIYQSASLIFKILQLFLASLAPLMFLVGVIVGLDRAGAQQRLLEHLDTYGKTTDATISYIDDEYNRAGVDYLRLDGRAGYGTLDLRYYDPVVRASIQPGAVVRIIYIDALISEGEKTVLAEHFDSVTSYPLVPPDVWGILLASWLLILFYPQFVFLGMVDFDTLMKSAVPEAQ